MSVIVMGMEMPTICITELGLYHSCPLDRVWCAQRFAPAGHTIVQISEDQEGKLPDWCPLRPLPKKHGRLIDADALMEKSSWYNLYGQNRSIHGVQDYEIASMETIVEAEGE